MRPVRGCGQRVAEAKRYCQAHSREAFGHFRCNGSGEVHLSGADDEVLPMFLASFLEMGLEPLLQCSGQRDDTMFAAFAVVHGDGALREVEVFDAEAEASISLRPLPYINWVASFQGSSRAAMTELISCFERTTGGRRLVEGAAGRSIWKSVTPKTWRVRKTIALRACLCVAAETWRSSARN